MTKLKKTGTLLLAGIMASLAMATTVSATTKDAYFPEVKIGYTTYHNTPLRAKDNTTSTYVNNRSGMNLWIYVRTSDNKNQNVGNSYVIVPTGKWGIRQNVYERGYRSCKLNISTSKSGVTGTLRGEWSPDSAGTYPKVN